MVSALQLSLSNESYSTLTIIATGVLTTITSGAGSVATGIATTVVSGGSSIVSVVSSGGSSVASVASTGAVGTSTSGFAAPTAAPMGAAAAVGLAAVMLL